MLHCNMEVPMEVLILVCLTSLPVSECQRGTSVHEFYAPELQASASGCFAHGMMFAAQSRLVGKETYPKIVCLPAGRKVQAAGG
jgi:hypothetical protein